MDLSIILTPHLFLEILNAVVPFKKGEEVDLKAIEEGGNPQDLREICFPVLKKLSLYGAGDVPDLIQYLPAPESANFVEQALGFVLLLDQGTRACCSGVDVRYIYDFFDHWSLKLSRQLYALPPDLQPHQLARWTDIGYSFDYWIVAANWFSAPFTHATDMDSQRIQTSMADMFRKALEEKSGRMDPYFEERDTNTKDIFAMSRVMKAGAPDGPDVPREDIAFWVYLLLDIHVPIIEKFGRYPYLNWAVGLDMTEEEKEYLKQSGHIDRTPPEIVKRIRDDVDAGRWSPFGDL